MHACMATSRQVFPMLSVNFLCNNQSSCVLSRTRGKKDCPSSINYQGHKSRSGRRRSLLVFWLAVGGNKFYSAPLFDRQMSFSDLRAKWQRARSVFRGGCLCRSCLRRNFQKSSFLRASPRVFSSGERGMARTILSKGGGIHFEWKRRRRTLKFVSERLEEKKESRRSDRAGNRRGWRGI